MFAPVAAQDLSWPDPQFGDPSAILKWLECSQAYVNIPLATTDDVTTIGDDYGTGTFKWIGSAMAPNGLICAGPHLRNTPLFVDTNNDYVATSSYAISSEADSYVQGVIYCAYDDSFYLQRAPNRDFKGLIKINASNTSSFSTGSILSNTLIAPGMWVDQDTIYLREWGGFNASQRLFSYSVKTGVTASIANISASDFGPDQALLAANNKMFFPNQQGTQMQYYDFNTGLTGSVSGTSVADEVTIYLLMPDGNYYTPPGFTGNKVYKLDPNALTVSVVYTGSPYVSGSSERDKWLAWFPNNTIGSYQGISPYDVYAYDYANNTATSVNFTLPLPASGDNPYSTSVLAKNATYIIPCNARYVAKLNKVNLRNLLNGATFSGPINTNT
jgi:hypothetical protein